MKEGTASHTARSVAAHRLEYPRIEAPAGDPAADDALARDVARSVFTPEKASELLAASGWKVIPGRERMRFAGLLLARAAIAPRGPAALPDDPGPCYPDGS